MKIRIVHLNKPIYWKVNQTDRLSYELKSYFGCSVINPLVYSKLISYLEYVSIPERGFVRNTGKFIFISSMEVMFILSDNFTKADQTQFESFIEFLYVFLEHLRCASKQADLANDFTSTDDLEVEELPDIYIPKPTISSIKRYLVETAITWKSIEVADNSLRGDSLAVYTPLLLDAIKANLDRDYRRAILYSAISVETMASVKLDEAYQSLLHEGDSKGDIRLITIPQRGGGNVVKDPIYEYLSNKTDFKQLIHERPLYLLRQSLLAENEQLYRKALKLYGTRNKIVHKGDLTNNQNSSYFEISMAGASEAIKCAANLFQWFGITEVYPLPYLGFN